MKGGAVDALLLAGDDILRSIELRLRRVSWYISMVRRRTVPDESRIEGVQEQQLARCNISRL